jgi:arsenite methyltransferase
MTDYLSYQFTDSPEFVNTFDEAPLWSAAFGLLLLKHVELKPGLTVLDLGSGTGFPLLELAQRLGSTSKCYGIDPWTNANNRARQKIHNYKAGNAEVVDSSADNLKFDNSSVDLIVSNLGINNFDDPDKVFKECARVLKPGGKLALTTNLNGHWKEFYEVFEETLAQLKQPDLVAKLKTHQEHRGTIASVSTLFTQNGLTVTRQIEDTLDMNFLDGTALLNHYFVKLGWLSSWKEMIPEEMQATVFMQLEENLNNYAHRHGTLRLSVPMAFIEGQKV